MKREYKLYDQLPFYCIAAVIQMIEDRNKLYVDQNQDKIISYFDPYTMDTKEKNICYSIKDMNKQYFITRSYPLVETYYSVKSITMYDDSLNNMISEFLHSDDDFILFANYTFINNDIESLKEMYNFKEDKFKHKHCFLISEIIDKDNIYLVCPETEENGGTSIIKTTEKRILDGWECPYVDKSGLGYSRIHNTKKGE